MGPAIGQAIEYISQVLSQRGPQAVPYEERYKWTIREHLSELLKMFPNLTIKVSEFHTNDGRMIHLVKAEGTVPIHYQAHKYNIPIVLWLPERYPLQAPIVYVCPTSNMIIKTGHSFVDASGLARSPCIAHWLHPSSDLSSTCQEMAMLFGAEPPLYTKPPGYVAPTPGFAQEQGSSSNPYAKYNQPQQPSGVAQLQQQMQQPLPGMHQQQQRLGPQQYPNHTAAAQPDPSLAGYALWGPAYAAATAAAANAGPAAARPPDVTLAPGSSSSMGYGGLLPPQAAQPTPPPPDLKQQQIDDLTNCFQGLAARALAGRLQAGLEAFNRHAADEMDQLLEVQRNLMARDQQLQALVSSIQQERVGTEDLVAQLGRQSAALETWLNTHEWKADAVQAAADAADGGLDVSKVIVPADDLSRQALAAQAEDLAVEDCLLVLEKALLQGTFQADVYMKQVRLLCRRQFLARALGLKVAQAQKQQPRPRSAGAQTAAYALTHGDTWTHR
eukprot:GHRR01001354.1.p1 GENE.GHRR01001354.1~~GHRR01001354.1.p1  ORF type:complete len:500 (+),score=179.45 GHRR01001354.1:389-1888(+)